MRHPYRPPKLLAAILLGICISLSWGGPVQAVDNPQPGSTGLQGKVSSPPPTQAATIGSPSNGQSFTSLPVTVSGLCKTGLLVKIFDNDIFMGAVVCANNSYTIQIDLFSGQNVLVARVYDALDQAGPDSNKVTVTFTDGQYGQFGGRVTLTSVFARKGADPNSTLSWPITINGGTGPYAVSVDWGDGTAPTLISVQNPGTFNIEHIYKSAGQYKVIVKATDKNGTTAYLQLAGVGNGQASAAAGSSSEITTVTKVIWWPVLLLIPFAVIAFWLGKRQELVALRRSLEQRHS